MSKKEQMVKFYKRWGIEITDEVQFENFKNRVLMLFSRNKDYFSAYIDEFYRFKKGYVDLQEWGVSTKRFVQTTIYSDLEEAPDLAKFCFNLQVLFSTLEDKGQTELISDFTNNLHLAIENSPTIDFRISQKGDKVILYPAGAKLLDERVVEDTLEWLESYPEVAKRFQNSLAIYLKKDIKNYRNLLDDLRFALEKLLQELLSNEKSLENQGVLILQWMEDKGAHVQIRNLFQKLLSSYIQYQNDAVKHGEEWAESDLEYLIYQTAIFMRLLLVLNGDSRQQLDN